MTCDTTKPKLQALVDGELPRAERDRVEDHLARCEDCRAELDALRRVQQALAALPGFDLPEGFAGRVAEAARIEQAGRSRWRGRLAVAASILLAVVLGIAMGLDLSGGRRGVGSAPREPAVETELARLLSAPPGSGLSEGYLELQDASQPVEVQR